MVHIRQFHSGANYPHGYGLCYGCLFLVGVESCTECDEMSLRLDIFAGKRIRGKTATKCRCWQWAYLSVRREFDIPETNAVLHTVAYLKLVI
jgi:hypothetical protein